MSDVKKALTRDHVPLTDTFAARRYFAKFDRITGHLTRVGAAMEADRLLSRADTKILAYYVGALDATFQALSMKFLMTGRDTGPSLTPMAFDAHESGFPVFGELLQMANDAQQAGKHLAHMKSADALKSDMVETIVGQLVSPSRLQFALSQRLYYEALTSDALFWAQNDPDYLWIENDTARKRRRYLVHWAVYDSQINLPTIYLLELEDSGRTALPKDQRRWPEAQAHLMAQSVAGLKLLTIAQGFDRDFDDLHPKTLRRIHIGPMYSNAFTRQTGPIREVLYEADSPAGDDWTLAWTVETLESERVEQEKKGWFGGSVDREIFALDPFSGRGVDTGATRVSRAVIMPERPFQVLAEKNPPGFRDVRKFVVNRSGRVVSYR